MKLLPILIFCEALSVVLHGQLLFTGMSPEAGPPGTVVTLFGDGFDPGEGHAVMVNGAAAQVIQVDSSFIRFSIPAGAMSGPVEVTADGAAFVHRWSFTVTRPLDVQIDPATELPLEVYTVGTFQGDAAGPGPTYQVQVAVGEAALIAASGEDETMPALLGFAMDRHSSFTLSAESTALAMVFLAPGLNTLDHGEAAARLEFLASRAPVRQAAQGIQAALARGDAYAEDPVVLDAVGAAILDFIENYSPAPRPGRGRLAALRKDDFANGTNSFLAGYPRELPIQGLEILRKLESSAEPATSNSRGVPVLGLKVAVPERPLPGVGISFAANPLDWSAVLYELDPADTNLSSLQKVNSLRYDELAAYRRRSPRPLDRLHIKAKPVFRGADLVGMASDWLISPIKGAFTQKEYLEIPADRSGLYMVRAHSGAWFPRQNELLDALPDGARESTRIMAINLVLAVLEGGSIVAKGHLGEESKCLNSFLLSLIGTIDAVLIREEAQGTLNGNVVLILFLEGSKSYLKDYVLKCIIIDKALKGVSGYVDAAIGVLNVFGKVSSAGKLAERINALGNLQNLLAPAGIEAWIAQSVESTIAVVGHPWSPVITSFFPKSGYRGTVVRLGGRHFSPRTNENLVTFGALSTDPENPAEPARAEVLEASETALLVRVPEEAQTGIITVAVTGNGSSSTADLPQRFRFFTVLDDPVITHLSPMPPVAGRLMEIHGRNFAALPSQQMLDFSTSPDIRPSIGNREMLLVRAPGTTNTNSVKVMIEGRESNELQFAPVLPAVIEGGADITVSTATDGDARDGDITMREAILLASGVLSYEQLTHPPDPRPPGQSYETDWVALKFLGDGRESRPGAGFADRIVLRPGLENGVLQAASKLPPLGSFDSYFVNATLDGTGVNEPGLHLDGQRLNVRVDRVRNFGGHGILVTGSANELRAEVEQCGGDGIRVEGTASRNEIVSDGLVRCAGDGLRLAGEARGNEVSLIGTHSNGQFAARLEASASFNQLIVQHAESNGTGGIRIAGEAVRSNRVQGGALFSAVGQLVREGRVMNNAGPGLWIDAPSNLVHDFNVAGNLGDGVLIEGSETQGMQVWGIRAGYDLRTRAAHPNQGSGIHIREGAHDLAIGLPEHDASNGRADLSSERNYLGGNRDHGLLIEGVSTRNIDVTLTSSGWVADSLANQRAMPNGKHGIVLTNGANNIWIGGMHKSLNVSVANETNGAGIFIAGARTSSNWVFGCELGSYWNSTVRKGNRFGLQIAEGAYANVIGLRGAPFQAAFDDFVRNYESRNLIQGNLEAGILLEAGGDPNVTSSPGATPFGGNVIQNNHIGGDPNVSRQENRVGILIRQGAEANRIGGSNPEEANEISYNAHAGIEIDGAAIPRPERANRIVGNKIHRNGRVVTDPGDPLAGSPDGTGVSIVHGARGHTVGGGNPGEANDFWENHTAIFIGNAHGNQVLGNRIRRNKVGGVVLVRALENTVGPFNDLTRNGTLPEHYGGVTLLFSTNNQVVGNTIGFERGDTLAFGNGNHPHGVGVMNSSQNLIGELGNEGRNFISANPIGVLISGIDSVANQVANNYIGRAENPGDFVEGNAQSGILVRNTASANLIGGERPVRTANSTVFVPSGNWIQRNGGDGVQVRGGGTIGNRILNNSITGHSAGLGIENTQDGNFEIPPPVIRAFDGTIASGVVDSARVPDGSLVQIFADGAEEGQVYLADATVRGGAFQARIGFSPLSRINATVTHALSGSTSEFGPTVTNLAGPGLEVLRVTEEPVLRAASLGALGQVVLRFKLRAHGSVVLLSSLSVRSSGTVDETTAIRGVLLYEDVDKDGLAADGDRLIGGPAVFTRDDGTVSISGLHEEIQPGEGNSQEWLLVANLTSEAQAGQTVALEIPSHFFVSSRGLFSGAIVETGDFSLVADTLVLGEGVGEAGRFESVSVEGNEIVIEWTGDGGLEEADLVTGPWLEGPNAGSPVRIQFDSLRKFYRLKKP